MVAALIGAGDFPARSAFGFEVVRKLGRLVEFMCLYLLSTVGQ